MTDGLKGWALYSAQKKYVNSCSSGNEKNLINNLCYSIYSLKRGFSKVFTGSESRESNSIIAQFKYILINKQHNNFLLFCTIFTNITILQYLGCFHILSPVKVDQKEMASVLWVFTRCP